MARIDPGWSFTVALDGRLAIGMATNYVSKTGHLVWLAEPTFSSPPTIEEVAQITRWRWPVFFPLEAARRKGLVSEIGVAPVPMDLVEIPQMRSGHKNRGWVAVEIVDGQSRVRGPTADPGLPIYQIVNDSLLKEMLESGWSPADVW